MRSPTASLLLVLSISLTCVGIPSSAQELKSDSDRKVVSRVMPSYPEMARTMHLTGVVKVEATVASNGTVKSVSVKGGHPILVQAAANAVAKWKWAPAAHETKEPVEVRFQPE